MQIPEAEWRSLSHRERRALVNKERRRIKRKAAALKREEESAARENQPGYLERLAAEEVMEEERQQKEEAQRLLEHEAWLERERKAQEEFRRKKEKEEKEQKEKEERECLIREEWELLQKKEKEAKEKKENQRQQKEERLQEALATEHKPAAEKPTHNPLAPEGYSEPSEKNYGTEKDSRNCPFFLKTGACRFGDSCSRLHPHPVSSTTLLIPGMYSSLGLSEWGMGDRDDSLLEYEEGDMYQQFRSFYEDVFPEFTSVGKVIQFKVSCNYEPHLRGNVYVQYQSEEECTATYQKFNGRWYAQRQLSCQFCPVQRWRNAICGLYSQKRCPKGKHCNFLHVFRNPRGAFSRADRDLHPISPSPPPSSRHSSHYERRECSRSRSRSRDRHRRRRSRERSFDDYHRRRRRRSESRERRRSESRERRRRSESRERRRRSRSRRRRSSHSSRNGRRSTSTSRRRERSKRQSSESDKDEKKPSDPESNGLDAETSVNIATSEVGEGKERATEHKKKKKRKKRSDDSLSLTSSSSKRRHRHKKRKHKRKREDPNLREPEEGNFDSEGTAENPGPPERAEKDMIFEVTQSAPETETVSTEQENCGNENTQIDQGSPESGPPNSDPSAHTTLDSVPQGSPLLQVPSQA